MRPARRIVSSRNRNDSSGGRFRRTSTAGSGNGELDRSSVEADDFVGGALTARPQNPPELGHYRFLAVLDSLERYR